MKNFTNKYQLSKTLRFELIPQGKTSDHIKNIGLLSQDEERANSYKKMKKTIDEFHKHFIELAMKNVHLTGLESFAELYFSSPEKKKEDSFKKDLEKIQTNLRKEVANGFQTGEAKEIFSKIDKKELITELLEDWKSKQENEDIYFDESFKNFTTYFGGFHENRKNMYSDKEQSTSIAYRLIHENLPKFLDNIRIFERIKAVPEVYEKCNELYKEIEEYLNISTLDEAFELNYFNETLTQKQIDVYNLIIGGRTPKEGVKKIQGLNEIVNIEYNQKPENKKIKIPKLKPLYKQILSDRESTSYVAEKFEESSEVVEAINGFYHHELINFQPQGKDETENVLTEIQKILASLKEYNLNKIYIRNDKSLTDISQALFGDWSILKNALEFAYLQTLDIGKKGLSKKQETEKEKYLKQTYFSVAEMENALLVYKNEIDVLRDLSEDAHPLSDYFKTHFKAAKKEDSDKDFDLVSNISAKYSCIKGVLEYYPEDKILHQDKTTIDNIKLFLDALMELLHFVKPLILPNDSTLEKDDVFYGQLNIWYEQLNKLTPLYNKVRNYATQKPYSTEKFKLNFENSHFLNGWATEYSTKGGLIITKDDNYFLVIVDKKLSEADVNFLKENPYHNLAKRIVYDFQKPDNKNIPRLFIRSKGDSFSPAVQKYNLPINEVIDIYDKGYFKTEYRSKNPIEFKKSLIKLIDYFKEGFTKHSSYSHYEFNWKESKNYNDISEFYKDVENSCYRLYNEEINFDNLLELVNQGKLYLFQIYNKDFSSHSKGTPNLHTLYWKALFDAENLKDVVYKLNGQAEIFYRKKSIEHDKIVVHKAKEAIDNKNPKAIKKQSTFDYDITKDKRFTVDKFQFHVPITLNFKATGGDFINQEVLTYLQNNLDVNIIGIDRGERHLIYISLIDQKGNILKQETLNSIVNEKYNIETPYHTLLAIKEEERDKARKNWGTIENIKELKEGYLSQVVHKIAKMMVEHNAIVVMEDLNFGFKRGRFKVDKQVYQKLEKMLIDKLNYLVFKDKAPNELGGLYKALQLTNKFTSFKDLGKQSGFLFYVPAWNTSKIDPTTGFVNLFNTKYENVEKAQKFFDSFQSIQYNTDENYFEFVFDYNDFTTRAEGTKTDWMVCTYGERICTFRNPEKNNQWDNKTIHLTEQFEDLFGKYGIVYGDGADLKEQIAVQTEATFFKSLLDLFKLTLQMRNSISNSAVDYLISPVRNSQGEFYDSRKADSTLPKDADANGAYHIAKKGLMWLEQIHDFNIRKKDSNELDWKKLDLDKTNKGWLKFVQSNEN